MKKSKRMRITVSLRGRKVWYPEPHTEPPMVFFPAEFKGSKQFVET